MKAILKIPSAFLPLAMSFGAFATVIPYIAMFGTARQADERTAIGYHEAFDILYK